jgi:hypothetical protein
MHCPPRRMHIMSWVYGREGATCIARYATRMHSMTWVYGREGATLIKLPATPSEDTLRLTLTLRSSALINHPIQARIDIATPRSAQQSKKLG